MKKKTRIVELVISDDSQELTIDAISLVSSPAIEEDFVFFGKEKNNLTFAKIIEEQKMLISPALIPNKQIYRYDANTDTNYYVWFSKETVRQASELYLKYNNHHKATYEHSDRVSGVLTIESWIKEGDKDKSSYYGFDLPIGTWFVKMKIENDDLWQKVKSGELKGISIEGYFIDRMETMSKTITDKQIKTAYKELQAEGKVKLALAGDLEKADKEGRKFIKELAKSREDVSDLYSWTKTQIEKFNKSNKEYKDTIKKGKSAFKELMDNIDKAQKAIKELGISPNDMPSLQSAIRVSGTLRMETNDVAPIPEL